MPTVKRFDDGKFKAVIQGREHNPPHIHILSESVRASFEIKTGALLVGECPGWMMKRVQEWLDEPNVRTELLAKWAEYNERDDEGE